MFYSKTTGGFYSREIHGGAIPADAVEITEAQHAALLSGQGAGKVISADDSGNPILVDPPKATPAQIWNDIKAMRDQRKGGGVRVKVGNVYKWFHSDDASRIQQMSLVMMGAGIPADLQWKTMDGTFIGMTQAVAQAIFTAAAASDQVIFTVAEQHKTAMEASAEPSAYDYSGGWPKIYGE